ncbi:SMP-30/gluconolactonase/LRE family protein [Pseudomonas sp. GX19020]|uniref:SMP-30/gluconolactonase/LRE family protein n=1 Tax=Pseudomonas sp. GX19020 TaxID=2942277 RepID=UPI0020184E24|nr:SMP-30/gluconolactonase/LRE family protein [Pseudomonas sp. GX19020]MCL4069353.1 SMP-30/gluconolactonase/LRE family protein [Pseudomonas sp. GX19020]
MSRISLLDRLLEPFRGQAITIPPYDGAWKPDTRLETAAPVAVLPGADSLARDAAGGVWASAGPVLYRLTPGGAEAAETYPAPITAITGFQDGLALALEDGGLILRGGAGSRDLRSAFPRPVSATALMEDGGALIIAEGSATHKAGDWVVALMRKAGDGGLWRLEPDALRAEQIATRLAWPSGLARAQDGSIVLAEAFAHRLTALTPKGARKLLDRIPGYPGRLSPALNGGWWLTIFAPRNRLVELVLQENHFRADMLATVPQEHWIAPGLSVGHSFLEPLQRGGVRTMGLRKPWAPARSYGLVARLDAGFGVLESYHSRADGRRHGAVAVLDLPGQTLVALKGAGEIVDIAEAEEAR